MRDQDYPEATEKIIETVRQNDSGFNASEFKQLRLTIQAALVKFILMRGYRFLSECGPCPGADDLDRLQSRLKSELGGALRLEYLAWRSVLLIPFTYSRW